MYCDMLEVHIIMYVVLFLLIQRYEVDGIMHMEPGVKNGMLPLNNITQENDECDSDASDEL